MSASTGATESCGNGLSASGMDRQIGHLLQTGMVAAASVILLGGWLFLCKHRRVVPDYHIFRGEPSSLTTLSGIVHGVLHGNSLSITQFGMVLLISTPVARVIFSVYAFLRLRDYQYVVISGIVLIVLLGSFIWH